MPATSTVIVPRITYRHSTDAWLIVPATEYWPGTNTARSTSIGALPWVRRSYLTVPLGPVICVRSPGRLSQTDGAAGSRKSAAIDSPNTALSARKVPRLGSVTPRSIWLSKVGETPAAGASARSDMPPGSRNSCNRLPSTVIHAGGRHDGKHKGSSNVQLWCPNSFRKMHVHQNCYLKVLTRSDLCS